jgi:hypothetical protein
VDRSNNNCGCEKKALHDLVSLVVDERPA